MREKSFYLKKTQPPDRKVEAGRLEGKKREETKKRTRRETAAAPQNQKSEANT